MPGWLAILAALAVAMAVFYYFTGPAATLPVQVVPHLQAVPVVVEQVVVGAVLASLLAILSDDLLRRLERRVTLSGEKA